MIHNPAKYQTMPIGVVLRRKPGVTRWQKHVWTLAGVLPGAGSADWTLLREVGDVKEYHVGTIDLELHGADADAYLFGLNAKLPCLYVVLRDTDDVDRPLSVLLVTASPYEAQDYCDSGEELVEKVSMPPSVLAFVMDFVDEHYQEQEFKKRKRDKKDVHAVEDGIGDRRISQLSDVYRSPMLAKKERLQ